MPVAEVLQHEEIAPEPLQAFYRNAGLATEIDADGDLLVSSGVTCYVIPTQKRDRVLLMAFVGAKDDVDDSRKVEFANSINNRLSMIRSRVNDQGRIIFDYSMPIEGGVTAAALVAVTQFFLDAVAYAVKHCDEGGILR